MWGRPLVVQVFHENLDHSRLSGCRICRHSMYRGRKCACLLLWRCVLFQEAPECVFTKCCEA